MYGPVEGLPASNEHLPGIPALAYADYALCRTSAAHVQGSLPN